jgi:hypothetical protein
LVGGGCVNAPFLQEQLAVGLAASCCRHRSTAQEHWRSGEPRWRRRRRTQSRLEEMCTYVRCHQPDQPSGPGYHCRRQGHCACDWYSHKPIH